MNISGDIVKKLDEFADITIYKAMDHGGHLCVMASEENEDLLHIPDDYPHGKYVLLYDPLDGSGNIDANVTIGTIFSVLRAGHRIRHGDDGGCSAARPQAGRSRVCALRVEHDVRLLHRSWRSRIHAGSVAWANFSCRMRTSAFRNGGAFTAATKGTTAGGPHHAAVHRLAQGG